MPTDRPPVERRDLISKRRFLHPAALRPGVVLALSTTGYAGFSAFVPLYVDQVGLESSGLVFAEYAVAVLAVRIFGARLPDRLGSVRGATLALVLQTVGLLTMCAWHSATGLYVATFVYSMGVSLLYPALFPLVMDRAPEHERSQAVATFTLFFDVSQGLGAFVLGIVVSLSSERWSFGAAGLLSLAALLLLRGSVRRDVDGVDAQPSAPSEDEERRQLHECRGDERGGSGGTDGDGPEGGATDDFPDGVRLTGE
jgi:MFS family permease